MAALDDFLDLVTSEHRDKPNYIAMLTAYLQPMVDGLNVANEVVDLFDVETAEGVQLDIIGLWVGRSRNLQVPLTGVYFTFDTGPGFDRGIFKGPFDPTTGLVVLPDDFYRILLKAVIAANQWDGSIPEAYAAYAILLEGTGLSVLIYDFQDMSMAFALVGGVPTPIMAALFTQGLLDLKPAGVRVRSYAYPDVDGPVFAFDLPASSKTAGFDTGAFAIVVPGS